jgi:hypothetical protein
MKEVPAVRPRLNVQNDRDQLTGSRSARFRRNLNRSTGFECCNTREGNHHEIFNDNSGCGFGAIEHVRNGPERRQFP